MIRKFIVLVVLAGLGYVGYLVWTQYLSDDDKTTIKQEFHEISEKVGEGANKAAKGLAETVHDALDDGEDKKSPEKPESPEAKSEKPAPAVPDQPGKIKMKND